MKMKNPEPSSHVKKKRAAAYRRIIDVATREFSIEGPENTTMASVANALGQTASSLYYYFASKEEMLAASLEHSLELLLHRILDGARDDIASAERLHQTIGRQIAYELEDRELSLFVNSHIYGPQRMIELIPEERRARLNTLQRDLLGVYADILKSGHENGDFTFENLRLSVFNVIAVVQYPVTWYRPGGEFSIEEIVDRQCSACLLMLGYSGPGGRHG